VQTKPQHLTIIQVLGHWVLLFVIITVSSNRAFSQFTYYDEDKTPKAIESSILYADAKIGVALPIDEALNQTFTSGLNAQVGVKVNVLKNRFFIKPRFGVKYLKNEPDDNLIEKLVLLEAGMEFDYNVLDDPVTDFAIGAFVDFQYNWLSDYYLFEGDRLDVLSGEDAGLSLGLRFKYHIFYLDFAYKILEMNVHITQRERDDWDAIGVTVPPLNIANLNAVSLSGGVTIPLYLFRKKSDQ